MFSTYLVEDWAIVASLLAIAEGKISWGAAYAACFFGILSGDILLYLLGRSANISPWLMHWSLFQKVRTFIKEPRHLNAIGWAIIVARAVPGTRFVTYTGAGLVAYSAWRFFILIPLAVAAWVLLAFTGGGALLQLISTHWFFGLMVLLSTFTFLRILVPVLIDPWNRKSLMHTWRRWFIFEFWPAWFAYAPLVPYYIYLSIKNGSVFHPFYANPSILNGGLIGEAKWDILGYLDPKDPATLTVINIPAAAQFEKIKTRLVENYFEFPLICKPNVGQRGFAVRIIKNWEELESYAEHANFDFLIQQKSRFRREAGIFYIRRPGEDVGEICSITDKDFPFVVGDGKTKLGDLILNDRRARIIAPIYFGRHRKALEKIIAADDVFYLSECGNHSQGAIFIDGQHLRSEPLRKRIDQLAHRLPHFYFGRFDVRYRDHESLMLGHDFEIVEINGAGADITHIYDEHTKVREAYRVMFGQWRSLFEVGKAARAIHGATALVDTRAFLKECLRVNLRKNDLSVST